MIFRDCFSAPLDIGMDTVSRVCEGVCLGDKPVPGPAMVRVWISTALVRWGQEKVDIGRRGSPVSGWNQGENLV